MVKTIWISFDFGLKGDYQGLYSWLDSHKAKDCGSNLACLKIKYSGNPKGLNFTDFLKKDIVDNIKLSKTDRLYVVFKDTSTGKMKGRWISGNRKAASWDGYANIQTDQIDDEGE